MARQTREYANYDIRQNPSIFLCNPDLTLLIELDKKPYNFGVQVVEVSTEIVVFKPRSTVIHSELKLNLGGFPETIVYHENAVKWILEEELKLYAKPFALSNDERNTLMNGWFMPFESKVREVFVDQQVIGVIRSHDFKDSRLITSNTGVQNMEEIIPLSCLKRYRIFGPADLL
jgi:hypothetical protein